MTGEKRKAGRPSAGDPEFIRNVAVEVATADYVRVPAALSANIQRDKHYLSKFRDKASYYDGFVRSYLQACEAAGFDALAAAADKPRFVEACERYNCLRMEPPIPYETARDGENALQVDRLRNVRRWIRSNEYAFAGRFDAICEAHRRVVGGEPMALPVPEWHQEPAQGEDMANDDALRKAVEADDGDFW